MAAALILPALTLIWEIVKALFFSGGDSSKEVDAAVAKYREQEAKIRAAVKKAEDTEGDTSDLEDIINRRKP